MQEEQCKIQDSTEIFKVSNGNLSKSSKIMQKLTMSPRVVSQAWSWQNNGCEVVF